MSPSFSGTREFTEAPVEPGRFSSPEFLDIDGVRGYFGLKQSLTYRLLAEDKIRAVSIRQRGKTRGRRLFDVQSIRQFLNSQVDKEGAHGKPVQKSRALALSTNRTRKGDSAKPGKVGQEQRPEGGGAAK
jgi:hypothetical protein